MHDFVDQPHRYYRAVKHDDLSNGEALAMAFVCVCWYGLFISSGVLLGYWLWGR